MTETICVCHRVQLFVCVLLCVLLVIAMLEWVGAGMEMMVDRHAGLRQEGLFSCRETPEHFPSAR